MTKCPHCGSADFTDTVRLELCHNCGYEMYYGDAHATGEAQLSKLRNPGDSSKALPKKPEPDPYFYTDEYM